MIVQLPLMPGLVELGPEFGKALASMCVRNGWDARAITVLLYLESRYDPSIQLITTDTKTGERGPCLSLENPKNCAVGLLQWNRDGARASGLPGNRSSLEKLVNLSAVEQVPYIEAFFKTTVGSRRVENPADYYLAVLGRGDTIGKADSTPLYTSVALGGDKASNRAYQANKGLDADGDGIISVGDMRAVWSGAYGRTHGKTVAVVVSDSRPTIRQNGPSPVGLGIAVALLGVLVLRKVAA